MTKREEILTYPESVPAKQLAEHLGVSERYVNYVRNQRIRSIPPSLNIENYIKAITSGIENKNKLADYFGVTRQALNKFERKTSVDVLLYVFLLLSGKNEQEITREYPTLRRIVKAKEKAGIIKKQYTSFCPDCGSFPKYKTHPLKC